METRQVLRPIWMLSPEFARSRPVCAKKRQAKEQRAAATLSRTFFELLPCHAPDRRRNYDSMMDLACAWAQVLSQLKPRARSNRRSDRDIASAGTNRSFPQCNRRQRYGGGKGRGAV